MNEPEQAVKRHERWLAEHEGAFEKIDSTLAALADQQSKYERPSRQMEDRLNRLAEHMDQLSLTTIQNQEGLGETRRLLIRFAREGTERLREHHERMNRVDERLDRLTALIERRFSGNGDTEESE
jgi:hypothetical protein